jgi:Flp pilus assembly protein TadD
MGYRVSGRAAQWVGAALLPLLLLAGGCSEYWGFERSQAPTPTPQIEPYNRAVATAEAGGTRRARAQSYFERADVQYGLGNFEQAIADYGHALEFDPHNARIYNNRAVVYAAMGELEQAIADYDEAVRLDPDYVRAYENRLTVHERMNDLEGMAADYERLGTLQPENRARYFYRQAEILRGLGYVEGSFRAFSAVLAADPNHVDALYERALLHFASRRFDEALSDLNRALAFSPQAANAHYARGMVYHAKNDYSRAIDSYTQALALRPGYAEALLGRAAAYHASGDRTAAVADLARAEQLELDEDLQHAVSVLRMHLGL